MFAMRQETTTRTLYQFSELSEEAQQKAIEKEQQIRGELWDSNDTEYVYHDANTIAQLLGITINQRQYKTYGGGVGYEPAIYYSGFYSQGDGACFEGSYAYRKGASKLIRDYAPLDKELHRIADELQALQKPFLYGLTANMEHSGHYYHSGCMRVSVYLKDDEYRTIPSDVDESLTQLMRDFADWIYKQLRAEYEYQTSEEACHENLTEPDAEFTEDGERA